MRFILVDEILELVPGQRITAHKFISPEEDFFPDHFPGFPVVPGVLLTEMMAQAAGKCLEAEDRSRGKPMLTRIVEARFRDWMHPGELAVIHGQVKRSRPNFAIVTSDVQVDARNICSAELMFSFVQHERFASDLRDEVLERFMARSSGRLAG